MLLATGAQAVAAPATQTGEQPTITVTGERPTDAQVQHFVEAFAIASHSDRLARFESAVCPVALGLADKFNRDVEKRLRRLAAAAGMRVEKEGCGGNVLVFVTTDKKALLGSIRKTRPRLFGQMTPGQISSLVASAEPAIAWQVLEIRGADGRTLANGGGNGDRPDTLYGVTSSRLLPQTRVDVSAAVVVLEASAVSGVTVTQLADYAAMRAFAHTDPDAAARQNAPTILKLLADKKAARASPLSLTAWDLAYLKSLYGITNMLQAGAQRGELQQLMRRNLAEAPRSSD